MKTRLSTFFSNLARAALINLGLVAVSLPLLTICLLLTFSSAFWLYDLTHSSPIYYISRRVMLMLMMPGCLGSLALNGFVIYRLNRYLEERCKEN
jgi:hypothetical protein